MSTVRRWLRRGSLILLALLGIEYFAIPEVVGASRNLDLLGRLNPAWLGVGVGLETASILSYVMLLRAVIPGAAPRYGRLVRIVLATTALAHTVPGGAAGGAGLGYRLLTLEGIEGSDAAFTLGTAAIGSAAMLNAMLWVALIVSVPIAGVHPIYVAIAWLGATAMLGTSGLIYTFTRGQTGAVRVVRAIGRHIPRLGADRLEQVVHDVGHAISHLSHDRGLLRRAVLWAAANWLLDAASLWSFLAALGRYVNPLELFIAYGIANVLGAIPVVPGGLGIIDASAATLLVGFGTVRTVATLGVIGWRLVNFWLPIPIGGISYLSLRLPHDVT